MNEWFLNMQPLARGFTVCAIIGALLFIFRFVLQLLGSDDADAGESDFDAGGDTDISFQYMSLHGFTVFILMFGLVGRALLLDSGTGNAVALAGALAGGALSVWGMAQLYVLMARLQSSGNLNINNAVGAEGTVYLTIPGGGSGQVQVAYQNRLHVEDAITEDEKDLPTGARIVVTGVRGGNTLIVKEAPVEKEPAT